MLQFPQLHIIIILLTLLAFKTEAPAQILWKHTTSDWWGYNPETGEEDSSVCLTALSCKGDNCTAAGRGQSKTGPTKIVIYRSVDGGKSWFDQPTNVEHHWKVQNTGFKKVQQIDSLNVIAMAYEGGSIIRTTDGGATWFNIKCPVERDLLDIHFSDSLTGVLTCLGVDSNVYLTNDGGKHWIERPFTPVYSCHSYGNGKYRFFKYGHGPFYTTYDNFATIDSTPPIFDSVSDPEYQYVLGYIAYGRGDTMFAMGNYYEIDSLGTWRIYGLIIRSTDDGKSWDKPWIFPWMKLGYVSHISSIDRDTIFAGGGIGRHYIYSIDRGTTWHLDSILIDTIHETGKCFGMEMSKDGHPIAAFGSPGFAHESTLTRGEYILSGAGITGRIKYFTYFYPNPTTGIVNIESIDRSQGQVTVIDIFGREVLKGGRLSADGKLTLDLSHVPTGIYNVVFDFFGRIFIAGKVAVMR